MRTGYINPPLDNQTRDPSFFHSFTPTDKGFFYLIPKLLVKPGIIAKEYNEGKRKTYFSPIKFVLAQAITSLIIALTIFGLVY